MNVRLKNDEMNIDLRLLQPRPVGNHYKRNLIEYQNGLDRFNKESKGDNKKEDKVKNEISNLEFLLCILVMISFIMIATLAIMLYQYIYIKL